MGKPLSAVLNEAGETPVWDWTILSQQEAFLTSASLYQVLSGGFGTGKTSVLCGKVILNLLIPGNLGYLGRMDGKALRQTTMQVLEEMLAPYDCVGAKNDQQGFLRMKPEYGGSKLVYGDFKDLGDLKNHPLGFFAIDQMEEVTEEVWLYLCGRLRRRLPKLHEGQRQYLVMGQCEARDGGRHWALATDQECRLCGKRLCGFNEKKQTLAHPRPWDLVIYRRAGYGVCNPEGPSHWIYQYFAGLPGTEGRVSEGKAEHQGLTATIYDAQMAGFVDDAYVEGLARGYASVPVLRDRFLLGLWVEAEGLVYPSFSRATHVLSRHARRPDGAELLSPHLPMDEFIDHGVTAPTICAWVVVEACACGCGRDTLYLVDEYSRTSLPVSHHAQAMLSKRAALPYPWRITYLDSQAFSKSQMGQKGTPREDSIFSIADEYGDHGLVCIPNQKSWEVGRLRITELLALDPTHRHPVTGDLGAPHFFVLSHCSNFLGEIETYKWKKARNTMVYREEPQDGHDDFMDGLNGYVASRPESLRVDGPVVLPEDDWDDDLVGCASSASNHMGL